jgi:hypothetical protein
MDVVKTYFGKRLGLRVNIDDFLSIQLKILKVTSFYSDKNTLVLLVDHFCSTLDKLVVDSHDLFEFQQLRQFHHQRNVRHIFNYSMVQKLPVQEAVQSDCDAGEELGKSCFAAKNRQPKIRIETIKQNTFSSLFLLGGGYNIFIHKLDSHNDGKSER